MVRQHGIVTKHGVDVLDGLHLQQVLLGKGVHRIVKVVEMQQRVDVFEWAVQHASKRQSMLINVDVQEHGLERTNRSVFQVVLANRTLKNIRFVKMSFFFSQSRKCHCNTQDSVKYIFFKLFLY